MNNKELTLEKRQKVAKIIREARENNKITQQELADKIGCARSTIVRLEQSKFSPSSDQLYLIADALGIEIIIDKYKI